MFRNTAKSYRTANADSVPRLNHDQRGRKCMLLITMMDIQLENIKYSSYYCEDYKWKVGNGSTTGIKTPPQVETCGAEDPQW